MNAIRPNHAFVLCTKHDDNWDVATFGVSIQVRAGREIFAPLAAIGAGREPRDDMTFAFCHTIVASQYPSIRR